MSPRSTKENLARALEEISDKRDDPRMVHMIAAARDGYYDAWDGPLGNPMGQLIQDAHALGGMDDFVRRVMDDEFEGTDEEREAWAASAEGRETFAEFGKLAPTVLQGPPAGNRAARRGHRRQPRRRRRK